MCENFSYNAVKSAADFFLNSLDSSKSKNEEGLFFYGLVQMKEGQSTSEFLLLGEKKS